MVATLGSIYHGEESLPIQGICARCRGRPARARWEQINRSVAQPAEYFCGDARAIGTFSGIYWAFRCCATAPTLQSTHCYFCLGQRLRQARPRVEVMHLVSCSPCPLAFTFFWYHSNHARRTSCDSTHLESCLLLHLYFSRIPCPSFSPLSPLSTVHRIMLCLTRLRTCTWHNTYNPYRLIPSLALSILYRLALVL